VKKISSGLKRKQRQRSGKLPRRLETTMKMVPLLPPPVRASPLNAHVEPHRIRNRTISRLLSTNLLVRLPVIINPVCVPLKLAQIGYLGSAGRHVKQRYTFFISFCLRARKHRLSCLHFPAPEPIKVMKSKLLSSMRPKL
jgi:hypothetical protein